MSQPKAAVSTFNTGWQNIKSWAKQQGLPDTAVNNVYALDQQRIQSGSYAMSNAERTRAILAAAGQNYSTALPTDAPSASDVLGNTVRNVQSIGSGLMPNRLVSNIWDTIKSSVQDISELPGSIAHGKMPADLSKGSLGADLGAVLSNTVASWLPGAADIGTVLTADPSLSGDAGFKALAKNPVTSILDVIPLGKIADMGVGRAVAKSSVGDALAARTGITTGALAHQGALRLGGMALGSIKIGKQMAALRDAAGNPILDDQGLPTFGPRTIAQRASDAATSMGTGKILANVAHTVTSTLNQKSHIFQGITKDLTDKVSKLTPDKRGPDGTVIPGTHAQFNQLLHDGQPAEKILNDPSVPVPVKEAVQAYQSWEHWHQEYMMASGQLVPFKHADGTVSLYEAKSGVFPARAKAEAAQERADAASAKSDKLLDQAHALDKLIAPRLGEIASVKTKIQAALSATTTLNKSKLSAFSRLTGRDGLLDQVDTAFKAQDWKALGVAARKASSMFNLKSSAGWVHQPDLMALKSNLDSTVAYAKVRGKAQTDWYRAYYGTAAGSRKVSAATLNKRAEKAHADFLKYVRANPSGEWTDAVKRVFEEKFLASDQAEILMDQQAAGLKSVMSEEGKAIIDRVRSDPKKLREIVVAYSDPTFHSPFIPDMTPKDHAIFRNSALEEVDSLRARGKKPMYVPSLSPKDVNAGLANPRITFKPNKAPTVNAAYKKTTDMASTVNDVMLAVDKSTKDVLERDAKLESFRAILQPMLTDGTSLRRAVIRDNLGNIASDTSGTALASVESLIRDHYGLEKFDVRTHTGLDASEFGLDPAETYYLPAHFGDQMTKMFNPKSPNKLGGYWDKSTRVFKYSILGLSPRYTAHITLGGSMLLALRVDPRSFLMVGKVAREVNKFHRGEESAIIPGEVFQGAGQYGTPDQQIHYRGGAAMAKLTLQEKLVERGINPKLANVAQFARAAADINFRFTNYVSDIQRSIAYLDGARHADRVGHYVDPTTGATLHMTSDRAHEEGMRAAERVMGNLQAMTPLERTTARFLMPFYGWTKHIIKYVLSYPTDHPYRAMFLSQLATQNSEKFSSGLDQRMQLLFFLGSPDSSGNVTAIDARQINPFRDVANYATISGWFSAMNPIITGPLETIDPQLLYGGNVLHPSITYNSVYGTNQAGPAGSIVTAFEQEIPELQSVDTAIGLTSQARTLKAQGGAAASKAIFSSLGIPWLPQKLNLQQIAATHEIDRYHQAANEALNAWQTGDFSALMAYPGSVPDPLQAGYNITPAQLQKQYADALKVNPDLPPAATVAPLPAPVL